MENKYRVLMIEDTEEFYQMIEKMLDQYIETTFELEWFDNLASGIKKLQTNPVDYDIILLDLDLPDSRGINTLQSMVSRDFNIPIVVISGSYENNVLEETLKLGAQDFLPKGQFNKMQLIKTVLYAIEKHKLQEEIAFRHAQIENREKKFRTLAESSSDGIIVTGPNMTVLFVNRAATQILARKCEEMIGDIFFYPVKEGETTEIVIKKENEENTFAEIKATRTCWNTCSDYLIAIRDITTRKKAEIALEENLDFVNKLIESIPNPIFIKDTERRLIGCNEHYLKYMGITSREAIGKAFIDFFPEEAARFIEAQDQELLDNPGSQIYEKTFTVHDGSTRHVIVNKATFNHKDGTLGGIIGLFIDITERQAMELRLRQSEEKFSTIFQNNPDPIAICQLETGKIVEVNEAFMDLMGYSRDELLGNNLDAIGFWTDKADKARIFEELARTEKIRSRNLRIHNRNVEIRHVLCSIDTLNIEEQMHFMVICKDITEQKKLEDQLFHAQKMETVGRLAAGIAHEINTPIQYVHDNIDFMYDSFGVFIELIKRLNRSLGSKKEEITPDMKDILDFQDENDFEFLIEEIPSSIEQSIEGIERVTKIVKAMKSFAHPGIEEMAPLNLNDAIESTITVARNEWKYVADINTVYNENLPPVMCYAGDFKQIILNLIVNAAHAIGDTQKKEGRYEKAGIIDIKTNFDDKYAIIELSDNGSGIPPEAKSHIFEPFFTTKPVGIGTGQGLAIVYNIVVKKHNGTISFDSTEGEGTRFLIKIPISQDK